MCKITSKEEIEIFNELMRGSLELEVCGQKNYVSKGPVMRRSRQHLEGGEV